eukprot:760577-Hanusia_phi.AAC.2
MDELPEEDRELLLERHWNRGAGAEVKGTSGRLGTCSGASWSSRCEENLEQKIACSGVLSQIRSQAPDLAFRLLVLASSGLSSQSLSLPPSRIHHFTLFLCLLQAQP